MFADGINSTLKTTTHKVVLPFYVYAALSYLAGTLLLFDAVPHFSGHYFHPQFLAITHCMALGWGTMMIMGAAHQLVPVMIEGKLHSNVAGYLSFGLAAVGIPFLVYGFYTFNMGASAQWGGSLVVAAILIYLVNLAMSMAQSKSENVHAAFVFMATLWLLATTLLGLALVFNFSSLFMKRDSVSYLSLHAHMGIVGWFLLMVIGVGSKLIPMFLLSKYKNNPLLWWIFALLNLGLLAFVFIHLYSTRATMIFIPLVATGMAILLFIYYCLAAWKQRIRKKADEQMKLSLLSVAMLLLPFVVLILVFGARLPGHGDQNRVILAYGFLIFFGWISSLVLGMSFKTLPFIVWNKVYHKQLGSAKLPNPRDLFSRRLFRGMALAYLPGILLFTLGILSEQKLLLESGALCLVLSAAVYNLNIFKIVGHKAEKG